MVKLQKPKPSTNIKSGIVLTFVGYVIGRLHSHFLQNPIFDDANAILTAIDGDDFTTSVTSNNITNSMQESLCTPEICRSRVFVSQDQGGYSSLDESRVKRKCDRPMSFGACNELAHFTGLQNEELMKRLRRVDNFHFEGEHLFWNPQTSTELAWYYSSSVNYLFANVLHPADRVVVNAGLEKDKHEPVLDYSGGVGNNVIYLAEQGIRCQYFGIGWMEKAFAEYRFRNRGYLDSGIVKIRHPFVNETFDPINSVLPRDESLGAILAIDVLEHIPKYWQVVEAMVDSLKVDGVIIENSPFAKPMESGEDTRVHLSDGGVKMAAAMGPRMRKEGEQWTKIASNASVKRSNKGTV